MKGKMIGFLATIVLPIALFLVSPYWSAYFSDKKELSYEILLKRQLTNIDSAEKNWPGIKISYEGVDVSTGSFLTLAITNTGKLPIKREDFDSPILIHIPEKDSIVSFQTAFAFPSNLDVTLTRSKEGLAAAPLLLNPGDRFVVEVFSRIPLEITDVTSRVVGLPKITLVKPEKRSGFDITIASPTDFGNPAPAPIGTLPGALVFLLTHVMLIGSLLSITSAKQKQNLTARAVFITSALVQYLIAIASLKYTLLYLKEILEFSKTVSFLILMASTLLSALAGAYIKKRLLSDSPPAGFKVPFKF